MIAGLIFIAMFVGYLCGGILLILGFGAMSALAGVSAAGTLTLLALSVLRLSRLRDAPAKNLSVRGDRRTA